MKIFISWPGEISHKIALALREGLPLFCPLLNCGYLLVLEIAVWTDEEGSRSAPATIASGVFAGAFAAEYGLSRKDRDGKIIGEELDRIGYRCDAALPRFKAFFEAHMEEGPLRQAGNMTAGVVTGIQGIR